MATDLRQGDRFYSCFSAVHAHVQEWKNY